jgi:hypothetical protein
MSDFEDSPTWRFAPVVGGKELLSGIPVMFEHSRHGAVRAFSIVNIHFIRARESLR